MLSFRIKRHQGKIFWVGKIAELDKVYIDSFFSKFAWKLSQERSNKKSLFYQSMQATKMLFLAFPRPTILEESGRTWDWKKALFSVEENGAN